MSARQPGPVDHQHPLALDDHTAVCFQLIGLHERGSDPPHEPLELNQANAFSVTMTHDLIHCVWVLIPLLTVIWSSLQTTNDRPLTAVAHIVSEHIAVFAWLLFSSAQLKPTLPLLPGFPPLLRQCSLGYNIRFAGRTLCLILLINREPQAKEAENRQLCPSVYLLCWQARELMLSTYHCCPGAFQKPQM